MARCTRYNSGINRCQASHFFCGRRAGPLAMKMGSKKKGSACGRGTWHAAFATQCTSSRPVKNTANGTYLAVGSQIEKKGVFSPFLAFFVVFLRNIVFVPHYDLKCIFQDN